VLIRPDDPIISVICNLTSHVRLYSEVARKSHIHVQLNL